MEEYENYLLEVISFIEDGMSNTRCSGRGKRWCALLCLQCQVTFFNRTVRLTSPVINAMQRQHNFSFEERLSESKPGDGSGTDYLRFIAR